MKYRKLITKNFRELIVVVFAFVVMILLSCLYVGFTMARQMNIYAESVAGMAQMRIQELIRIQGIILSDIVMVVSGALDRQSSPEELRSLLIGCSKNYLEQKTEGEFFAGLYGVFDGNFVNGNDWDFPEDYDPASQMWYGKALAYEGEAYYSDPYTDTRTGALIGSVSQIVYDRTGIRRGVIRVDYKFNPFIEHLDNVKILGSGYAMLLGPAFRIISHPHAGIAGKHLLDVPGYQTIYEQIGQADYNHMFSFADYNGVRSIGFFSRIYNNWQLGFVVPFWFYYREVYVIAPVIIVLGTALMLIVCNMLLRFSAARIRADEENKYKSSFLARMSHEIRTPMNIVIGMSELIMRTLREGNAKQAQEYVSSIRHAGDNLLSIINDILDFSKIESGKIEIANTGYLFSSLLNDVLSITRMRLNESPVLFATRIDSSLPRAFKGDEIRIRQILLNILVNAVKYTREGYIRLTVGHGGDAAPDGYSGFPAQRLVPVKGDRMLLSFKISDTGIGIKQEDMGKLFEDFTRFDLKHNYTIEGTGLGLAISRNLCRLMGGDIRVKSVYGRGSVFTITLPQEIEDPAPLAELENPKTKNVLVYETQRVYADSLAYTIENLGAGCAIVSNKEDFLNRLENNSWQFVFTPSALFEEVRKILREKSPDTTLICLNKYGESFRPNIHVLAMPVQPLSMANILNGSAGDKGYHQIEMPGIRFIAPDARILIVDDINTNLNVAEGLMTPYKMKIDCCLSGEEAVRLVENTRYDVIFMDHMMPGMDGVETVAAIRKWEQEQQEKRFIPLEYAGFRFGKTPAVSKGIPIIALTANAISGMREMFIEKGFNDYLAKPIEIARLDGILAKWIPREKQQKLSGSLTVVHSAASSLSLPPIQGVDTARGLVMTGGTEAGYRKVLASFYRDAFERLSRLENVPDERGIALFTIHVHALKSAAATIGAVTLSADAAALEEAGNAGDINTIREKLPDFCLNLSRISKEIEKALTVHADESGAAATVDGGVSLIPRLKELKTALEARNIETVDGIIAALEQEPLGEKPRDALEAISYQVLMSEFGTAIDLTEKLLKQLA